MFYPLRLLLFGLTALLVAPDAPAQAATQFFRIQVVDRATGRGVPMIELKLVDNSSYLTDSNGLVAFFEPGLMDKELFFHVSGHGYEYPADFFGYRGVRLTPTSGGSATIEVDRTNIAERIYRITGVGIYRDTRLLGEPTPIDHPFVNGQVAGQDSALATIHNQKIYWIWGDTNRLSYPLGNFKASGATSLLPGQGGLDPAVGIDLDYYVNADGFSREMAPVPGTGVVWLGGMSTAPDAQGTERMFAFFTRLQGLGQPLEQGIVLWNEQSEVFEKISTSPLDNPLHPKGSMTFHHVVGGVDYLYFANPYPDLRVEARLDAVDQPQLYQGYTPLAPGARFDGANTALERDSQGELVWAWKANTPPLTVQQQIDLVNAGLFQRRESPFRLRDADTGKQLYAHNGTVAWNAYRNKWLMVINESWGDSFLGEIWVAEAAALEGPWTRARKVVHHDDYSFYNVAHRPFFDQNGGRVIYFEGTYTRTFSGAPVPTPRYNYNQIMYRLDLSDPRLR